MPEGSRQRTEARSLSAMRSVGQLQDGWRGVRHPQQAAQVAELEVAVDEHDAHAGHLAEGDRQVVGDGGPAHATLA